MSPGPLFRRRDVRFVGNLHDEIVGLVLIVFLVIVLFWDTHRIAAIAITAAVFIAAALTTLLGVRASFRSKPKLLSFTLSELNKDLDELQLLARRESERP